VKKQDTSNMPNRKKKPQQKAVFIQADACIGEFITILICAFVIFAFFLAPSPGEQRENARAHRHRLDLVLKN
jgi:hypothetical protein